MPLAPVTEIVVKNGPAAGAAVTNGDVPPIQENQHPNNALFVKMEKLVERMQDEKEGVPVKTAKSFMSKVPSVITGIDLVQWLIKNFEVEEQEALNLASLMASHGYFFPVDAHYLVVTNDNTFYRFQTPYFWPSNCWEPENADYAVYLCKRTMLNKTRLELADYEAENLSKLQKMFSRNWEFIYMQAEAQAKVDRKRDKMERKVLDSQERAFWDVHRPMPGCVNTTEIDIKKSCKLHKPLKTRRTNYNVPGGRLSPTLSTKSSIRGGNGPDTPIEDLVALRDSLKLRLNKSHVKMSNVAQFLIQSCEQYKEYDPLLTPVEPANPWIADDPSFWELEKSPKELTTRRVKRWAFSLDEVLRDPAGKEQFAKFLAKEYSSENLNFYNSVAELKMISEKEVVDKVKFIFDEFLDDSSANPVNIDSKCMETTKRDVYASPGRHTFDPARDHIYKLMKSDTYTRFIKSEQYKELVTAKRNKRSLMPIRLSTSVSPTTSNAPE